MTGKHENDLPFVSIIIPVRNEKTYIRKVMEDCFEQDYPNNKMEIIIADGMSEDGTREELAAFLEERKGTDIPDVHIIDNPGRIVPTGLNKAVEAASGEIIARLDAHALFERDYIRKSVEVLQRTKADNVGGPTKALATGYIARVVAAAYNSPFSVGGSSFHNLRYEGLTDSIPFGMWRRDVLLKYGCFDEEFVRNQDDEFNLRIILAGGKVYQSPEIKSYYYPRDSFGTLFKQQFQYGYWKVRVIQKHLRPASFRHLVPVVFTAGLLAGPFLGLAHPLFMYAYAGSIALYLLLSFSYSLGAAAKNGIELLPLIPFVFFVYHFAYGMGFGVGLYDFVLLKRHTKPGAERSFFRSISR